MSAYDAFVSILTGSRKHLAYQVSIVNVVYSQSELLQKEVFLVEIADSTSKESVSHLKVVFFLRSASENIQHLRRQIASPRFGEYHLFFSNIMKDTQMHILADSDEQEVVQQVQVGAQTETELKEKRLSVEDALNATKAAVEEGIVVGGGCTLLRLAAKVDAIRDTLDNEEQKVYVDIYFFWT
ncbi:hypothetical protein IFM89_036097 [Coptis chinensis]|uniref:Uncharacterized protein n=1 Tax=Coptis chinensis TaxID=261450 RepID=A0A835J268_9MAGN|nr:hypothetical protein IFM89_036097 [Coptis chinensis]